MCSTGSPGWLMRLRALAWLYRLCGPALLLAAGGLLLAFRVLRNQRENPKVQPLSKDEQAELQSLLAGPVPGKNGNG